MPQRRWGNGRGKETEKSNRKREREIKIPMLWYLCHHHRWSIRLNIICLTEKDITWESRREKERKRGHICCSVDRCGDMEGRFPKKLTKNIQQKKCDINLSPIWLRIHSHIPPTPLPFHHSLTTCSYQREVILFLSTSFQSACQEKNSPSVPPHSLSSPLSSLVYLTFGRSVSTMFVSSSTMSCNWAKALFW